MASNYCPGTLGSACVPTVPGVNVFYWVTARTYQRTPQLFSAVLGNPTGASAARATAGLLNVTFPGTIYTLNRAADNKKFAPNGVNIYGWGNAQINSPGGDVFIDSNACGANCGGQYVATLGGNAGVTAGNTIVRGNGATTGGGFSPAPLNGFPDGANFQDPMSGKGQPPAPTSSVMPPSGGYDHPVTGQTINCAGGPVPPGYYYSVDGKGKPTGAPVIFGSGCTFGASASTFGQYVFFGGAQFSGNLTFNPGEFIFAGACPNCAGGSSSVLNMDKVTFTQNGTAGELFVFTDGKYTGLPVPTTLANSPVYGELKFGTVDAKAGNGNSGGTIDGLNAQSSVVPANFDAFSPVVWWTDQRSSPILYDAAGNVVTSGCSTGIDGATAPSIDNPCGNPNGQNPPPATNIEPGHANLGLAGTMYQPRGSTLNIIHGHGDFTGPIQLITGSINIEPGGGNIDLTPLANPPVGVVLALIE